MQTTVHFVFDLTKAYARHKLVDSVITWYVQLYWNIFHKKMNSKTLSTLNLNLAFVQYLILLE